MRRKAFTFWQMALVLVGLGILAAVLFPVFIRSTPSGGSPRAACQANLKQIALGIKQYIQDYDERYPRVNAGKQGWKDSIMMYVREEQPFQCPNDPKGNQDGTTDYFYNTRISGNYEASMIQIVSTILNGDGAGNAPSNANVPQIPKGWTISENSPARRHLDGANYAFADGHIKWLKPNKIADAKPDSSNSTFALW